MINTWSGPKMNLTIFDHFFSMPFWHFKKHFLTILVTEGLKGDSNVVISKNLLSGDALKL